MKGVTLLLILPYNTSALQVENQHNTILILRHCLQRLTAGKVTGCCKAYDCKIVLMFW